MDEYDGPSVIMMPPRGARRAPSAKVEASQFSWLPISVTEPMTGFARATTKVALFDVPQPTSVSIDPIPLVGARYVDNPIVTSSLKESMLDRGNIYTLAEIKAVLYLHGITIPKNVKVKKDYEDLARSAGVVTTY